MFISDRNVRNVQHQGQRSTFIINIRAMINIATSDVSFQMLFRYCGFCVFGDILKRGFEPDSVTIGTLVKGMCMVGEVLSAVHLFDKMIENGVKGNVYTYGILINGLCKIHETSLAVELHRKMLKRIGKANVLIA
ncbi:hypothetical protein ACSBR2_018329 [Camellia fascicularis]